MNTKAHVNSESPTCHNTMLVADTSFVSDANNSQPKHRTVNIDQISWLTNILTHLVSSVKSLDSMPKNGLERNVTDVGIDAMIDKSAKIIVENVFNSRYLDL